MTDPVTEINFEWKSLVDGEIAHVEEYVDGELKTTYGPMPATAVGPCIDECKARLRAIFTRLYGDD